MIIPVVENAGNDRVGIELYPVVYFPSLISWRSFRLAGGMLMVRFILADYEFIKT
jgi:hypothetical protein